MCHSSSIQSHSFPRLSNTSDYVAIMAHHQRLHEITIVTYVQRLCTRPDIGALWLSKEICTINLLICFQFFACHLILLDLQLINFPRACMISWEDPSRFPHFIQPWSSSLRSFVGYFEYRIFSTIRCTKNPLIFSDLKCTL